MKNSNYICHMPYLRNSKACDNDFWYNCVKWWYILGFFIFLNFSFFGLLKGWGVPYLRNSIAYDHDFWYTCVKWWYLQELFFKILIFRVVGGAKTQKMTVALHLSATRHHTIFIYGTDVQNDNISTCVFHFFKIMIFRVVRGVKGKK